MNKSKKLWNKLAREDAEYYILTDGSKKGGKWNREEFLKTGQEQWSNFSILLNDYGLIDILSKEKIALDVGCGIGRVTFAMCSDFKKVIGIDVSEVMIEKAKNISQDLNIRNVEFIENNGWDLSLLSDNSVDFVFSYIALQHCPSEKIVLNYIKEISRILKPGGVCLFQTRVTPSLKRYIRFFLSKKKAKVINIFKNSFILDDAFKGNWIYYPNIYRVISQNFSSFYFIFSPFEIYKERFWRLSNEYERWKRTFWICIK